MSFVDYILSNISSGSMVAFAAALLGGIISSLNPCCLPMLPAVIALVSHHSKLDKWKGFGISSLFVVGFALATAIMGALTASLGIIFGQIGPFFTYLIALVPLVMALHLFGVIHFNFPMIKFKGKNYEGFPGALITGFLFACVFVPCATPIFASILTYAAHTGSVIFGSSLLFVYGVAAGIPLIIMGSWLGHVGNFKVFQNNRQRINIVTGIALVGVALYLIWIA